MKTSDLLDERLAWPDEQRERGGPWRLGHGLASVGPGWWPLVRAAFAAAAEMPGAEVRDVRQKFGALELWLQHEDAARRCHLLVGLRQQHFGKRHGDVSRSGEGGSVSSTSQRAS